MNNEVIKHIVSLTSDCKTASEDGAYLYVRGYHISINMLPNVIILNVNKVLWMIG